MKFYIKTVSDREGNTKYFNFGTDDTDKMVDTESYYYNSGISITTYQHNEFVEFKEHYTNLINDNYAELAHI